MKQKIRKELDIVIVLCFLFIVIQNVRLGIHFYQKEHTKDQNESISQMAHVTSVERESDSKKKKAESDSLSIKQETETVFQSPIDFQMLKDVNSEIVAWIEIEDTLIDYPLLRHMGDIDYYTKHNYKNEKDNHGSIFFDHSSGDREIDCNRIIYGHHMKDGTMFADLMKYKDISFAKNHNKIHIFWENATDEYQVLTAFRTDVSEDNADALYYNEYLEKTYENYSYLKQQIKQRALYDLGMDWDEDDELLLLSTCEYSSDNGRFVVVAKKIVNLQE